MHRSPTANTAARPASGASWMCFARNGVKGTIDTNGRIAEDFPDALKELHAGGHEIVGHGWANDMALSDVEMPPVNEL